MPMDNIPTYDGEQPDSTRITITGKDEDLPVAFHRDEQVVFVGRAVAKQHNFKSTNAGVLRFQQQLRVDSIVLMSDDEAQEYLARIKAREDAQVGQENLDADIDAAIEGTEDG